MKYNLEINISNEEYTYIPEMKFSPEEQNTILIRIGYAQPFAPEKLKNINIVNPLDLTNHIVTVTIERADGHKSKKQLLIGDAIRGLVIWDMDKEDFSVPGIVECFLFVSDENGNGWCQSFVYEVVDKIIAPDAKLPEPLAADTEEIKRLLDAIDQAEKTGHFIMRDCHQDRLIEILRSVFNDNELVKVIEAKKNGRLAILPPCKIGDKIYLVDTDGKGSFEDYFKEAEVFGFAINKAGVSIVLDKWWDNKIGPFVKEGEVIDNLQAVFFSLEAVNAFLGAKKQLLGRHQTKGDEIL